MEQQGKSGKGFECRGWVGESPDAKPWTWTESTESMALGDAVDVAAVVHLLVMRSSSTIDGNRFST